ncbi:MAG: hypothetical protein HY22_07780 [[Candidatus Thermochlorobacteriaceae] bacterium GBChlB]|nr:MAG: hypothetical protein HY22_07780 [[Candidatus Thermochlorobacteriaceae] bacterium GBChlB]
MAYAVGSIPFAYLLLRLSSGKDIRTLGTGNVGAMNTFDVSGSKVLGILVGTLDAAKGAAAVLVSTHFFGDDLPVKMLAAFFATLGHCYPVWLGFKGGRGLATVAGATLLFMKSLVITWVIVWVLAWAYSKKIHFCNISATIGVAFIAPILEPVDALFFIISLVALILLRHRDVMKDAFKGG